LFKLFLIIDIVTELVAITGHRCGLAG